MSNKITWKIDPTPLPFKKCPFEYYTYTSKEPYKEMVLKELKSADFTKVKDDTTAYRFNMSTKISFGS